MKRVLSVAALVLAGATLTACGGGVDAPTDASKDDFCGVAGGTSVLEYFDEENQEFNAKEYGDALAEVGTPDDISDDEREGFEIAVRELRDAGDGLSESDLDDLDDDEISDDENDKVDAFGDYTSETCGEEGMF